MKWTCISKDVSYRQAQGKKVHRTTYMFDPVQPKVADGSTDGVISNVQFVFAVYGEKSAYMFEPGETYVLIPAGQAT